MKKNNTPSPFAELEEQNRKLTPRKLTGDKRELWKQLVGKYAAGDYAGLSMSALHDWGKRHLGLTCSVSCFRLELLEDAAAIEQ